MSEREQEREAEPEPESEPRQDGGSTEASKSAEATAKRGGLRGLDLATHPEVYAPREDSELMLDALDLLAVGEGDLCCDVGTGSGVLGLTMVKRGARVVAVDINPFAVSLARANAARNNLSMHVVRGDLLAPLRGPFDLVVFNPPYLPVKDELKGELPRAWEGGQGGIGWARLFLAGLHRTLVPGGRALVLLSSLGDPYGFADLASDRAFALEVLAMAKLPWEQLQVVLVQRS